MVSLLLFAALTFLCDGSQVPIPPQDAFQQCFENGMENFRRFAAMIRLNTAILPGGDRSLSRDHSSFRYKFVSSVGEVYDYEAFPDMLEVAATYSVSEYDHQVGAEIVADVVGEMPSEIFLQMAQRTSVGFFAQGEGSTIYPEYAHLRDRPECAGTCGGSCADTCTSDGRKWDSLAGVGGVRATCISDNFMCTEEDPYYNTYSVLVHEFAHTIHIYAMPAWLYTQIYESWENARRYAIWDTSSYAMSNDREYFAEGAGAFFHVNFHPISSGGMNSCGKSTGFCDTEYDARTWLYYEDIDLYSSLVYAFLGNGEILPSGLTVCPA